VCWGIGSNFLFVVFVCAPRCPLVCTVDSILAPEMEARPRVAGRGAVGYFVSSFFGRSQATSLRPLSRFSWFQVGRLFWFRVQSEAARRPFRG